MNILFDSQIFNAQKYGGISRYFSRLGSELSAMDNVNPLIYSPLYINQYLEHPSVKEITYGVQVDSKYQSPAKIASHLMTHLKMQLKAPDIIHSTYYYPEKYPSKRSRRVLTVYDMIHELFPQNFSEWNLTSKFKLRAVQKADHVICISESTRSDLLKMWDIDPIKVSVVHLGFDRFGDKGLYRRTVRDPNLPNEEFILYVGSRVGHKNFNRLLIAFSKLQKDRKKIALVCFGGGKFTQDEVSEIQKLGLDNLIVHKEGGDSILGDLYRAATLFVYPSTYEGFGIPPLEAMSAGCPVSAAQVSSIPEVCGNAVDYFNPFDVDDIAKSMSRVLNDTTHKVNLIKLGSEQLKRFTWKNCASNTLTKYHQVMRL